MYFKDDCYIDDSLFIILQQLDQPSTSKTLMEEMEADALEFKGINDEEDEDIEEVIQPPKVAVNSNTNKKQRKN